jgi:sugar/nucleoside kinase (ribokinase family)
MPAIYPPYKILAADGLTVDVITPVSELHITALIDQFQLRRGEKKPITAEEFKGIADYLTAASIRPTDAVPGGSSANTLTTLSKLLGDDAEIQFIGATGTDAHAQKIRDAMDEANIQMAPLELPYDAAIETAITFSLLPPQGGRTLATYRGNAGKYLHAAMIQPAWVADCDVVFVQGSLREKYEPAFNDTLMAQRWSSGKALWLALPTGEHHARRESGYFSWVIPSANVVLGNVGELMCVYGEPPEKALAELQRIFNQGELERHDLHIPGREQVGFITAGSKGAYVVTAKDIMLVPAGQLAARHNDGGSGDTAFAGFLAGWCRGFPYADAARMGIELAAAKIETTDHPRLKNPKLELLRRVPALAQRLAAQEEAQTGPNVPASTRWPAPARVTAAA